MATTWHLSIGDAEYGSRGDTDANSGEMGAPE